MKKLILIITLAVIGYSAMAQVPTYTRINSKYYWLAGAFDALNVPAGATPAKASGQYQRSGMLFYDTTGVDTGLYISHGAYWVRVGSGSTNASLGSAFKIAVDGTNNIKTLRAGEFMSLDSATSGSVTITNAGLLGRGDTLIDTYRYIKLPANAKVGGVSNAIVISNVGRDSSAFNVGYPQVGVASSFQNDPLIIERRYNEAWGDTLDQQYGSMYYSYLARTYDSASTRFRYDNRFIRVPNGGPMNVLDFSPPRDSVHVVVGQDGNSASVYSGYWQVGAPWGYNLHIRSATSLPRFPVSISHMTLDLQRNNSRSHPNGRQLTGNGIAGYSFNFKNWQSNIGAGTPLKGDYTNKIFGYHMYGSSWPNIGSTVTKPEIIGVAAIDSVFALYSEPLYTNINEIVNGYGLAIMGDSDYNFIKKYLRIGGTLPTRPFRDRTVENRPKADLEVYGTVLIQDGNQGSGKVLTSDANGIASWQTPSGGTTQGLQDVITEDNALTGSNSITLTGGSLLTNGANVFWNLDDAGGDIGAVATDDFSITAPDVILATAPTLATDTSTHKYLGRNSSTGEIFLMPAPAGGSSGLTVGTTTIASSNTRGFLYDSSGVLKTHSSLLFNTSGEVQFGSGTDLGAYRLQVSGSQITRTGTDGDFAWMLQSANGTRHIRMYIDNSGNGIYDVNNNAIFRTDNNTVFTINSTGNATFNRGLIINEDGVTVNTRIESDTEANMFLVDATNNRIGVATATPTHTFTLNGQQRINAIASGAVTDSFMVINGGQLKAIAAPISYGTYTPTLTNSTNVSASTAYACQYMRVGNTVTVSGMFEMTVTGAGLNTELGISLPIASNIANTQDAAGTGSSPSNVEAYAIIGDGTNDRAKLNSGPAATGNRLVYFTFTYRII